eukprot:7381402-Prymnesium_polylepis.1
MVCRVSSAVSVVHDRAITLVSNFGAQRNGKPRFMQVRYIRWSHNECGIQPGSAIWFCLAGYEVNISTILHTIWEHDGLVARAYLPNPSALLLKADKVAKNELADLLSCFAAWEEALELISLRKNMVPRDGGFLNGADSLIPQGVFINVLVKDGMTIEVFPADLPENGNIRWALDAVLVLDFFHDEGAASRARRPRRSVSAR